MRGSISLGRDTFEIRKLPDLAIRQVIAFFNECIRNQRLEAAFSYGCAHIVPEMNGFHSDFRLAIQRLPRILISYDDCYGYSGFRRS